MLYLTLTFWGKTRPGNDTEQTPSAMHVPTTFSQSTFQLNVKQTPHQNETEDNTDNKEELNSHLRTRR